MTQMTKIEYLTYHDGVQLTGTVPFPSFNGVSRTLINNIIEQYGYDYWGWYIDKDDPETIKAEWSRTIDSMDAWLKFVTPELEALSSALAADSTVESTSQTKFNDTPDTVGDYATDEHTSTISTSKTSGKLGTVEKANLASYNRLMHDLSRRFAKAFILPRGVVEDE